MVATLEHLREMRDQDISTSLGLYLGSVGSDKSSVESSVKKTLRTFFSFGLDSMYWHGPRGAYVPILESDPNINKFLSSRLPKSDMCEDVLAELHYWGWLKARGFEVTLTEEAGMPDMFATGYNTTFHAEVKAIHEGSSPDRVRKVIEKANKQIKRTKEQAGICVIRYVEAFETDCESKVIPAPVQAIIDCASSAMHSNSYKSVSKTVICWDEYTTRGMPPGWMLLMGIRRSHGIDHAIARHPLELSQQLFPEATIAGNILFSERPATLR